MELDEEEEQKADYLEEKEYFNKLLMRPLLDFNQKEEKLRLIENKNLKDEEFNIYVMQAYKLSKRKEAALDELKEDGIHMFTPTGQDPSTISVKPKMAERDTRELEYERHNSYVKKPTITARRASIARSEQSTSMAMSMNDDDGHVIPVEESGLFNE